MNPTLQREATVNKWDEQKLETVKLMTHMIREHQKSIAKLSEERRRTILKLRKNRITYREIADSMGTTEQNIYKIIRDDIPRDPETGKAKRGRPRKEVTPE